MRKRRVIAVTLSSALMMTTLFPSMGTNELGTVIEAQETRVTESKTSEIQQENGKEPVKEQSNDEEVYDDSEVDYEYIIQEAKQEEYRESVAVSKDTVLMISTETEEEIQNFAWYKDVKATSLKLLNQSEDGEKVSYTYEMEVDTEDVWTVVDCLNAQEEVVIAEPDYIYQLLDEGVPTEVSDEAMGDEWYLDELAIPETWNELSEDGKTAGEHVVVAVIDTGVDYTHEDLTNNMWVNTAELTGSAGVDDDGNGYVDDIYGISLIDNSGNPADDHGHGTHVAGIIGMTAGNGGGVGIAYQSQIMAIKAGQADGSFASSDIAEAIKYAMANGADVINMSFGGYGHSAIVEAALQDAFGKCVLVAAAGNDAYPTEDATPAFYQKGNMYPAAYSYVVGVMAYDQSGNLTEFSNWDYKSNFGAEYEIVAPGKNIYSTLPGNKYASWSGTSMAAPMVSAVAALIRSEYTDKNTYNSRFIMGQLVSATGDTLLYVDKEGKPHEYAKLNVADSLNNLPKPNITVQEMYLFDSPDISDANNGDGIVQAGETIDIGVILRNQWGAATDFKVNVSATSAGGVDNPYVEFLTEKEVALEDIGTFSTQDNGLITDSEGAVIGVENPVRIKIADNTPNDASILLIVNYTAKNQMDETDTTIYTLPEGMEYTYNFTVQKGKVLKGKITEDTVLTSDQYWIIENAVLIPKGVTVNVEPGTQIQFWSSDSNSVYADQNMAYIQVEGTLNICGTEDAPVDLFPGKGYEQYAVDLRQVGNGKTYVEYANITNPKIAINTGNHLNVTQNYDNVYYRYLYDGQVSLTYQGGSVNAEKISYSKFSNLRGEYDYSPATCVFEADTVLFDNCHIGFSNMKSSDSVYLINHSSVDSWEGIRYNASSMSDSGFKFNIPEYEISSIYEYDGYKYAVMKFDRRSYFMEDEWTEDGWVYHISENYELLVDALKDNGGTLGCVTYDNYDLLQQMYADETLKDMMGESNYYLSILTSLRYDEGKQATLNEDGEVVNSNQIYNFSTGNKSNCYHVIGVSMESNTVEMQNPNTYESMTGVYSYYYAQSSLEPYVLVKYPATTADEKIKNLYLGTENINMESYQSFYNNAILNRLTLENTSDWMRMTTNNFNDTVFYIGNNYWGTTSELLIDKQIMDFDDIISLADYVETPYLTSGNEEMYPFVTDIYITDKDGQKVTSIGNGTYEVHVLFNRDMDTTVSPYVTYGPDQPYTDYVVEGDFVSAREWVGTTTVNIIINQGTQYFRVKDAQAADDAWLTTGTDWGRFEFMIEASGAEALTLHGEGGTNQVALNWVQDDYETLAGYNLYRSQYYNKESENPLEGFVKVNPTVIGAGTSEYVDKDVLPGETYYYYFKVVDTAMAESKASNVVSCTPVDNVLPTIKHTTITEANAGLGVSINAEVTDNIGVKYVKVYYKAKDADAWSSLTLSNTKGRSYFVSIPANELKLGEMVYYIEAYDGTASAFVGTRNAPNVFTVKEITTITSVTPDNLDVSESGQTGSINGLYFADGMQVYVDGVAVDTQFVSEKKLTFTMPKLSMGQKDVSIYKDGVEVARFENAITYKDKTVEVYTDAIEGIEGNGVYVPLRSNFEGEIETIEIIVSDTLSYNNGSGYGDYSEKYQRYVYTYTVSNASNMNGLGELYIPLYKDYDYEILSFKINGAEVSDIELGTITVYNREEIIPVTSITYPENEINLAIGESIQVEAKVLPANATLKNLRWYTGDGCISVTSDGKVTGIYEGTGVLRAEATDGSEETLEVYVSVTGETLESIQLDNTVVTMLAGERITLNMSFAPFNAGFSGVTYSMTNWECADVISFDIYSGKIEIRAKEAGTATLEVCDTNNQSVKAICTIKVLNNEAYPEINENIITLSGAETYQATAVIKNADTEGSMEYTWSSSNSAVARVNTNGLITMTGEGTAVITVTLAANGSTDSIIVLCSNGNTENVIAGDINGDETVNVQDAMLALQMTSSSKLNADYILRADVNEDGEISSVDALMILQYATGKLTSFSN